MQQWASRLWLAPGQRQCTRTTPQKGYSLNIVINTLVAALLYQITPVTVASNINKSTQLKMEIKKSAASEIVHQGTTI